MKITNSLNLPYGMVRAASTERHNKAGELSATTLLQGVKQIILTDRHWDRLEDDVSNRIWAIWGTAVHALLENEGVDDVCEELLAVDLKIKGKQLRVTGRIDNYNLKKGVITDYKTASVWKVKFKDFEDWRLQGLIYAWLLEQNGFTVRECRFIALLKDHSKTEAARNAAYPQSPVFVYSFPVRDADLAEIETFINAKLAGYLSCADLADDDIPPCSEYERWYSGDKFAVKKEGRKTALRVFDSAKDADRLADELGKGHFVELRRGESKRCEGYCLCSRFCNFYRESCELQKEG